MRRNESSFIHAGRQSSGVLPKSGERGGPDGPARTVRSGSGWHSAVANTQAAETDKRLGQLSLLRHAHGGHFIRFAQIVGLFMA